MRRPTLPKRDAAAAPELPFDPAMPYPVPVPWEAPWDRVLVIYDLYACEAWLDAEYGTLTAREPARRALLARLAAIEAQPDSAEKTDAVNAWTQEQRAWARLRALDALTAYVLRVEWPDGTASPGNDPATWAHVPLSLLEWLTGPGYAAARDGLWHRAAPKAPPPDPPAA